MRRRISRTYLKNAPIQHPARGELTNSLGKCRTRQRLVVDLRTSLTHFPRSSALVANQHDYSPVAPATVFSCSGFAKCAMTSFTADELRTRTFVRRRTSPAHVPVPSILEALDQFKGPGQGLVSGKLRPVPVDPRSARSVQGTRAGPRFQIAAAILFFSPVPSILEALDQFKGPGQGLVCGKVASSSIDPRSARSVQGTRAGPRFRKARPQSHRSS